MDPRGLMDKEHWGPQTNFSFLGSFWLGPSWTLRATGHCPPTCYALCLGTYRQYTSQSVFRQRLTMNEGRKEGRKEVFYLTTHSTHLVRVGHMVKDHSDSERGDLLPPHGILFLINSKVLFYMHHPIDRIAHTMAFVTPVVEHWLEREIAQWVHQEGLIRRPIAP